MVDATPQNKRAQLPDTTSRQLDLFQSFYGSDEYSNTAEVWDSIPKNAVDRRSQAALRDQNGRLPVYEHSYEFRQKRWRVEVMPALITDKDGVRRDFYPSTDEELVEEVLRKFFADQRFGVHDVRDAESWVKFTLNMVRRELAERGKTRSLDEIKRSLEIMSLSSVRIFDGDSPHPAYTVTTLSDVVRVTRQQYIEDGKCMWAARLPALISKSVNEHEYRQFNYRVLMGLDSQLSRWLHKRLCQRFIQAGLGRTYHFKLSSVQRDSALLRANRAAKNITAIERALDALKGADVLSHWEKEERRGQRRKLEEVVYTVHATMAFASEQTAANARRSGNDDELRQLTAAAPHSLPSRR